MIMTFLLIFGITIIVSYLWVNAIDYMKENHSDYKGEDLFDEKIEESTELSEKFEEHPTQNLKIKPSIAEADSRNLFIITGIILVVISIFMLIL
jgi:uncharacterized membrane protein